MPNSTGSVAFRIKTNIDGFGPDQFGSYLNMQPNDFINKSDDGKTEPYNIWIYTTGPLTNANFSQETQKIFDVLDKHKKDFALLKTNWPTFIFELNVNIALGDTPPEMQISGAATNFMGAVSAAINFNISN